PTVAPYDISDNQLRQKLKAFAVGGDGGVIVPMSTLTTKRRQEIMGHIQDWNLPAIYPNRLYTMDDGDGKIAGLISRGAYLPDLYRKAGNLANQILMEILMGHALPTPVIDLAQAKSDFLGFETVINLDAAKAIGLRVPDSMLQNADILVGGD